MNKKVYRVAASVARPQIKRLINEVFRNQARFVITRNEDYMAVLISYDEALALGLLEDKDYPGWKEKDS